MSGLIKLSGVTLPGTHQPITNFVEPVMSVSAGLVGFYVFGGDDDASLINIANDVLPLTRVGEPVVNRIGASLDIGNCYDTGLLETAAFTLMAVAKPVTGNGMLISNYSATGTAGVSLYSTSTAVQGVLCNGAGATVSNSVNMVAPDVTDYNIFSFRGDATNHRRGYSHDGTLTVGADLAITGRTVAARNLRIGGHYEAGSFTGVRDIWMAAIWNAKLSDANEAQARTDLRTFAAKIAMNATL